MVNHSAPSGPAVMPGRPAGVLAGRGNSIISPAGVIRPILGGEDEDSVNHSAPSGPTVMSVGALLAVGIGNSVKVTANARPAAPPTAHNETITTNSTRRCRFCI